MHSFSIRVMTLLVRVFNEKATAILCDSGKAISLYFFLEEELLEKLKDIFSNCSSPNGCISDNVKIGPSGIV